MTAQFSSQAHASRAVVSVTTDGSATTSAKASLKPQNDSFLLQEEACFFWGGWIPLHSGIVTVKRLLKPTNITGGMQPCAIRKAYQTCTIGRNPKRPTSLLQGAGQGE